jgi:radical SAM family uncharacterized protein
VPRFYRATFDQEGRQTGLEPLLPEAPTSIVKQQIDPLPPAPTALIVPYVQPVHDRGVIEIMRGCTQGCRFCQAGMTYRPLRERSKDEVVEAVQQIVRSTGHADVGLISLSSADHSQIRAIIQEILSLQQNAVDTSCPMQAPAAPVSISLPSLRTDTFSVELAQLFTGMRRSGLTFAPEAGSQRLRDVINKKVTEQDLMQAVEAAYANHWQRVKLYFMIGLPTETDEDVQAIIDLVRQVAEVGYQHHGRKAKVSVTVSTFVPKPHTPFQWHPLIDEDTLQRRQHMLRNGLHARNIRLSYHDARISLLEAIIARGGRELSPILEHAWRAGARFDAWDEQLRWEAWRDAFATAPYDLEAEARRERAPDEWLPWAHISCGVTARYQRREYERATVAELTRDCRQGCTNCGARELLGCRPPATEDARDEP